MLHHWLIPLLALSFAASAHAAGSIDGCNAGLCGDYYQASPNTPPATEASATATNRGTTANDSAQYIPGGGFGVNPTATASNGSIDTKKNETKTATAETLTRTPGKKDSPFGTANDPPRVRAAKLENVGLDHFYSGVQQVAIGIAQLSQAERDRKEAARKAEAEADRDQAIQRIAHGNHDIELGRDMVKQAGAIKASEDRMATGGASSSAPVSSTPYQFNEERAPEATTEALQTMSEVAGVDPKSLIDAVNSGGSTQVLEIAAGAQGVQLSQAQLAAAMPSFPVSQGATASAASPGLGSGLPSVPVWSGSTKPEPKAEPRGPASVPVAAKPRREAAGREETLQPLSSDQLFGGIEHKVAASADEFGDPGSDLFGRVRGQLSKRRSELRLTKR